MKKTHFIELLNNIRKTKVSFISIVLFAALGTGIVMGCTWMTEALKKSTDRYMETYKLHDLEVTFPYGFYDEDIETLKQIDGVDEAEGRRYIYDYFYIDSSVYQARVSQITKSIDLMQVKEGTLPEKEGEVAVDYYFARSNDIHPGDTITLKSDSEGTDIPAETIMSFDSETDDVEDLISGSETSDAASKMKYLKTDTLVVTAIVIEPEYICASVDTNGVAPTNGLSVDAFFYVDESSFKLDEFLGYTDVIIRSDSLRGLYYDSDAYKTANEALKETVEETVTLLAADKNQAVSEKRQEILTTIDTKFTDAEKQITDGEAEISEKEAELLDGENKLADAKQQIADGEQQLADAKTQIESGRAQLESARAQLQAAAAQIESGKAELAQGQAAYNEKYAEWQAGCTKLAEARAQYDEGKKQYDLYRELATLAESIYAEDPDGVAETILDLQIVLEISEDVMISGELLDAYLEKHGVYDKIDQVKEIYLLYRYQLGDEVSQPIKYIDYFFNTVENFRTADLETKREIIAALREFVGQLGSSTEEIKANIEALFAQVEAKLAASKEQLDSAAKQIEDGQAQLDSGEKQLQEAQAKITDGQNQLAAAEAQYQAGLAQFQAKEKELADAETLYAEKSAELEEAKQTVAEKEKLLEDGKVQLQDAKDQLSAAKETYREKYESSRTYVTELESSSQEVDAAIQKKSSIYYLTPIRVMGEILKKIRFWLAGLFVLVGVLVCYSAMTRIVYSQMTLIGSKKALGFKNSEITLYYELYAVLASILGSILGIGVGGVCEFVVLKTIHRSFAFDKMVPSFSMPVFFITLGVQVVLLALIVLLAAGRILSENAVQLLAGPKQAAGKARFYEKFPIYKRLGLLNKTIINNCVSDKRRVIGTVIGILGCTAIIVTALTFSRDISKSFSRHFKQISHFSYVVYFDSSSEGVQEQLEEMVREHGLSYAACDREIAIIRQPTGDNAILQVYIPEETENFEVLNTPVVKENVTGQDTYEGLWMSYPYRNAYGADALSDIHVTTISGQSTDIPVSGYFASYITQIYAVISADTWQQYFGEAPQSNALLIQADSQDMQELQEELNGVDGYIKTVNFYENCKYTFSQFQSLATALVFVYLFLAVVMSVLVLLNLFDQFINEKKKELIVMLINGFSYKDAKRYIYGDTFILTIIGIVLGTALGSFLGGRTVSSFDSAQMCMIRTPDLFSCIVGIVVTGLLTFVLCRISLRKIDRFVLTDISKF